ncbi:MAG TPA: hypothetical protein VG367_05905 [Mucilaginibacter sp.]|jgi:hypothetical protein|nr:hypothetical protein [Mucilaginibacter sp.]
MKKIALVILLTFLTAFAFADTVVINHFEVKNNPFAEREIAIVVTDTAGHIIENVNGHFAFSINGFDENLKFDKGTAFYHHKFPKSGFLYVKHENDNGTHATLYYVYKMSDKLVPIHISWIVLLIIPVTLIVVAYMFRKLIILAVIILIVYIWFNYHNGLGAGTFFESIIDGLKSLFNKV